MTFLCVVNAISEGKNMYNAYVPVSLDIGKLTGLQLMSLPVYAVPNKEGQTPTH